MATPALHRLQLRTGPKCDGTSTALGFFTAIGNDAAATFALDSDESFEFMLPLSDRLATQIDRRQIVRTIFTDGSYNEWLIEDVVTETGEGDSVVRVTASAVLMLLADASLMEAVEVTGASTLAGSYTGTLTQLWDNVILPVLTAAGLTYVNRGTIDPTEVRTFTWAFGDTPLSLARNAASITKAELRMRRVGSTGYEVDFVARINGAAAPVVVRARKNLRALRHTESAREQATILYVQGADNSGGVPYSIARVRWQATAVNGGTSRLTLASPLGGIGPISEDGQFNTSAVRQYYLLRVKTGRLYPITGTLYATQEVGLPDVSDIAVGEYFEFREDNTSAIITHAYGDGKSWLRATSIATNDLTLDNPVTNGDPVTVNDQYIDWLARISFEVLNTTTNSASQTLFSDGRIKCTSVAGLQVGDWGCMLTNATIPYTFATPWGIFTITSIDAPNNFVTVVPRFPRQHNWAYTNSNNVSRQLRFFRERSLEPLVRDSVAATNVATVASGAGISTNDAVEIIQKCGGKQLARLISPSAVQQFGRKVGTVERDYAGDAVMNANPMASTWTGASSVPPDGWEKSAGGTLTRVAALQYGTYAVDVSGFTLAAALTPTPYGVGQGRVSVATVFKMKTGSGWDAGTTSSMVFGLLLGNAAAGTLPNISPSITLYGPAYVGMPAGGRVVREGETVTLTLENIDLEYTLAITYGVKATWWFQPQIQVDGVWIFPGSNVPTVWSEYGDGTKLWQEGAAQLIQVAAPETYDIDVVDIAAIDSVAYPYADLDIGRAVRLIDPDSNTARTGLRIQQKRVVYFDPAQNRIVVSTRARTLSEMLSGATINAATGVITYGRRVDR